MFGGVPSVVQECCWDIGWHLLRMVAADWDNMVIKHYQLMMNMLGIPDRQSLLNLVMQTL